MGEPAQLRVRLLGGLEVDGIEPRLLGSRKARMLVKLLVLNRGAPVSTDAVTDALWPDGDGPARPGEQIGVLVSRLRGVVGASRVTHSDTGWVLAVDWFDVAELEHLEAGVRTAILVGSGVAFAFRHELVREVLLADTVAARLARARAHVDRLNLEEAEADVQRALGLGGGAEAMEVAGWVAYYRRDYGVAQQRAEAAAAVTDDPTLRASCHTLSGRVLHASGHRPRPTNGWWPLWRTRRLACSASPRRFSPCCGSTKAGSTKGSRSRIARWSIRPAWRISSPPTMRTSSAPSVSECGASRQSPSRRPPREWTSWCRPVRPARGFVPAHLSVRSWLLRKLGCEGEADEASAAALDIAGRSFGTMSEMFRAAELDLVEAAVLAGDLDLTAPRSRVGGLPPKLPPRLVRTAGGAPPTSGSPRWLRTRATTPTRCALWRSRLSARSVGGSR